MIVDTIGYPGAGKTTLVERMSQENGWQIYREPMTTPYDKEGFSGNMRRMMYFAQSRRDIVDGGGVGLYDGGVSLDRAYARAFLSDEELGEYLEFEGCVHPQTGRDPVIVVCNDRSVSFERLIKRDGVDAFTESDYERLCALIDQEIAALDAPIMIWGTDVSYREAVDRIRSLHSSDLI